MHLRVQKGRGCLSAVGGVRVLSSGAGVPSRALRLRRFSW